MSWQFSFNFYAFLISLILFEWTAGFVALLWQIGLGVFQIHLKVRVQIYTEGLTHFIESKAKTRAFPIPSISSYQSIVSFTSPGYYQKWKRKLLGEKREKEDSAPEKIEGLAQ